MSEAMRFERLSWLAAFMLLLATAFAKSPLTMASTAVLLFFGLTLLAPYRERGTLAAGVAVAVAVLLVGAARVSSLV